MPDQPPLRLLIVDGQQGIRQLCAVIGGRLGLECVQMESAEAALQQMTIRGAELILADLGTGGSAGLELLAEVKRRWPLTEVALMSSYGSTESAVRAMRLGAYDFVVKPFRVEEFQLVLDRMAEKARLVRENRSLRNRLGRTKLSTMPAAPCTDLEELERMTVRRVFAQVDGDKDEAQRLLGISRATLYRKIKRYGIEGVARRKRVGLPEANVQAAGSSQD
jgi:DNA-binding NtrC family response regulator